MGAVMCIRSMRSIRRFRDQTVPDAILHDMLETARWCGSGKNRQPWTFVVIRNRETMTRLATLGEFAQHLANAALAIAIVMEGDGYDRAFDCGRVSQNLMLAAHAHGVGSCIAFILPSDNEEAAMELLKVPPGYRLRVVISFGYPAAGKPSEMLGGPARKDVLFMIGRKPLSDLVREERFR